MGSENQELRDLKYKVEGKVQQLEAIVVEKDKKLKSVEIELERTQQAFCLLKNKMNRLDHLITSGKLFGDHIGVGFKGESSGTKIVFIKSWVLANSVDASKLVIRSVTIEGNFVVQQSIVIGQSAKFSGQKRRGKNFVPICHFCGVKGHVRTRCFTMMIFLENNYLKNNYSRSFPNTTPRPKIDLGDKPRKHG